MKNLIKRIFFVMTFFALSFSSSDITHAAEHEGQENIAYMEDGNVIYEAYDKTATKPITWGTVGFTVRNAKTGGDPIGNKNYGKFTLADGEKKSEVLGEVTHTIFTFGSEKVEEQFDKAKVDSVSLDKNGGNVYLNGIIQVYHYGKPYGTPKYRLNDIMNAEGWSNPRDFYDRFDIQIPYDPVPQPVKLTIMKWSQSGGYKEVSSEEVSRLPTRSRCKVTTATIQGSREKSIPGTIESGATGNTLYLYRVYWARLREDKHQYQEDGDPYRKPRDKISVEGNVNPIKNWEGYKDALYPLRNRKNLNTGAEYASGDKWTSGLPFYEVVYGGIEIVCVYKNFKEPTPDDSSNTEEMTADIIEPYTIQTIQADNRFSEQFDSTTGIPTTESQYICAYTDDYLFQYRFVRHYGSNVFVIPAGKEVVYVTKSYSYWKIEDLNVYAISYARASNYSLPGGTAYLTPTSYYKVPDVKIQVYNSNMIPPVVTEGGVGDYTVWNDSLTFNGQVIMDSTKMTASTPKPKKIPASGRTNAYSLYQSGYVIDATKANGEYGSGGVICYTRIAHYGGNAEGASITYDIGEINDVTIHTPVVCDAKIEDVRKYNQLIKPNRTMASLVLDTYFYVAVPTYGYHTDLKGYGTRDYAKYTALREVRFPFDVMKDGTHYAANTWISTGDNTKYYLPVWVKEGEYTVEFRSRAINCNSNGGLTKTEELANTDYQNYVATDTVEVEVSGRVYNLNIYDISDYPIWQNVFRQPDSMKFTGVNYTVGTKDRNGYAALDWTKAANRNAKYTLPITNGSHPKYADLGTIKTGYYTWFSVDTIGNYDGENDYVHITPKFYYINDKGKNQQEVDLYYTQRFESTNKRHVLVKIGSKLDQQNVHKLKTTDSYLTGSGKLKGTPSTSQKQKNVYTLGNIMIPDVLMSFTGRQPHFIPQVTTASQTLLSKQEKAVQTWICEYYLPSTLYICPKGYDLDGYAKEKGALDFSEDFWLKKGSIIVNFELETIQDGERHLSYINTANATDGYCNMWSLEGGGAEKKDIYGNVRHFNNGDYALYYVSADKTVKKDYKAGGIY